jgi:hypothetical protein
MTYDSTCKRSTSETALVLPTVCFRPLRPLLNDGYEPKAVSDGRPQWVENSRSRLNAIAHKHHLSSTARNVSWGRDSYLTADSLILWINYAAAIN